MPAVSVIIPSYCTPEEELRRSIRSAAAQTLESLEVIVVDDNGDKAESRRCRDVVKSLAKDKSLLHCRDISYVPHGENKGLAAARRTGTEAARGDYVAMLDSDDEFLSPDACRIMYAASEDGAVDIVQCCAKPVKAGNYILESDPHAYTLIEHPLQGKIRAEGDSFAERYLTGGDCCLFLWAKLIRRETFLRALDRIPFMECFMAEDLLFSYFLARECTSYNGIPDVLYAYYLGNGISTSSDMITSADRWAKLCTPAAVFTAVMYDMQERPLPAGSKIPERMNHSLEHFVVRNIKLLERVQPDLKEEAHHILEESWGSDIISKAEEALGKQGR